MHYVLRLRPLAAIAAVSFSTALALPASSPAAGLRGDLGSATGDPRAVAERALARHQRGLGADASQFRFESVRRSLIGTHVRGRQFVDGLPVAGSSAIVSLAGGRIAWVEATDVDLPGGRARAAIGPVSARAAALGKLGTSAPLRVSTERMLVERSRRLRDVFRVAVLSVSPAVARTVDVSAASGRVLAVRDDRRFADAKTLVFNPNPIVSTKNSALRQPGVDMVVDTDLDSPELTAARSELPLREFDSGQATAAGRLVGPWITAQGGQPMPATGEGTYDYTRGMPGFEALMAYAHVDGLQRYMQETLGFTGEAGVNAESQDVIAFRIEGFDNSFYQPGNDIIVLGTGGVDDGEDAEVIIHEYGHAVQDAQVSGWGATAEGGAMGEGFGDFLAGTYFALVSDGFQDTCVADWDGTSYSDKTPPCLRRMDSTKRYPADVENQVHADGEIWSAFLWRMRDGLGATTADKTANSLKLVLASHELLTPEAQFGDAVIALRTAAQALGHPEWIPVIDQAAITAGFISSPSTPPAQPGSPGGNGGEPGGKTAKARVSCSRKLACRIKAAKGSEAAKAKTARLLRGKKTVAKAKIRRGKFKLRAKRKPRRGIYTLSLYRGKTVVHSQRLRVSR